MIDGWMSKAIPISLEGVPIFRSNKISSLLTPSVSLIPRYGMPVPHEDYPRTMSSKSPGSQPPTSCIEMQQAHDIQKRSGVSSFAHCGLAALRGAVASSFTRALMPEAPPLVHSAPRHTEGLWSGFVASEGAACRPGNCSSGRRRRSCLTTQAIDQIGPRHNCMATCDQTQSQVIHAQPIDLALEIWPGYSMAELFR
jgi:hypothetical protein